MTWPALPTYRQIIGAETQPGMQQLPGTTHGCGRGERGSFKIPTSFLSKRAD
jgi:hypothetical protein